MTSSEAHVSSMQLFGCAKELLCTIVRDSLVLDESYLAHAITGESEKNLACAFKSRSWCTHLCERTGQVYVFHAEIMSCFIFIFVMRYHGCERERTRSTSADTDDMNRIC